ncbi:hypothetical protein Q8A67_005961 [Cirrhinus molitorella]|uniref:Uncharacterized protein n=1 Tax=Cirrhinus molitorella TaxID=172907 RepID=A0AA88PZR2_9TELE|nr:hypothetical protein Q8A67_005961 [Cirrhinus molitorella]
MLNVEHLRTSHRRGENPPSQNGNMKKHNSLTCTKKVQPDVHGPVLVLMEKLRCDAHKTLWVFLKRETHFHVALESHEAGIVPFLVQSRQKALSGMQCVGHLQTDVHSRSPKTKHSPEKVHIRTSDGGSCPILSSSCRSSESVKCGNSFFG